MASFKPCMTLRSGTAGSPTAEMAMPMSTAKTIICNISPLASESIGLIGIILRMVVIIGGASLGVKVPSLATSAVRPGVKTRVRVMPMIIAMAVVIR